MAKKRKLENKSAAETPNKTPATEELKQEQPEQEEQLQQQQQVKQEDQENVEEEEDDEHEEDEDQTNDASVAVTKSNEANANEEDQEEEEEEEEEEEDSDEPVEKLLEPFSKDQLIDLLREASESHFDVLDRIRNLADVDPVHRKIFVHGLGWDTNTESLISAFKQYGEIEDSKAVSDKVSGKSKGYGFILFKHRSGARKALKEPQKRIGNRMTACQLASAGPVPQPVTAGPPVSEYTQRKIYVSNVSADIDPQKLLSFFAKYGEIAEGPLGLDKQTGKPKGFTLFVYKTVESAKKALEEPHKNFEGHILHCQRAVDGPKPGKAQFQNQQSVGGSGFNSMYSRSGNLSFAGGVGARVSTAEVGTGHLMAPSSAGGSFNQGTAQLNPVLGQALTALIASQGGAVGLNNLLGSLGSSGMGAPMNQAVPMVNNVGHGVQSGYGNQAVASNISPSLMSGYGNAPGMHGGYPNPQMGQASAGRSQQGAGHMGGVNPYMGR